MRSRAALVLLLAWSAVAGCSGGEAEVYPWPEVTGYDAYEGDAAGSALDPLIVGAHQAFGDDYTVERTATYAIADDEERDRLAADHGALLQHWDVVGSPGRPATVHTWERGSQRFTLVFVTVEGRHLAVTLATSRR